MLVASPVDCILPRLVPRALWHVHATQHVSPLAVRTHALGWVCRACLEYLLLSGSQPHILHVHEWQTSALPMLYWDKYHTDGLKQPRIVLTLHNLDNSGECRQDEFGFTGEILVRCNDL